jgi:hypothetical protein
VALEEKRTEINPPHRTRILHALLLIESDFTSQKFVIISKGEVRGIGFSGDLL